MAHSRLDALYSQLSDLRAKERQGQKVTAEIERILSEITKLETPVSSTIDVSVQGDAFGNAIGPNASVNADVIARNYNRQDFSSTTHRHEHYSSNPTTYDPHPANVEVIAGDIVAGWFQRAYNAAPHAVSVGLATILPVLFLFSNNTAILGVIGLLTITPIGVFVIVQTQFLRIPCEAYQENKPLYYASLFMTGAGFLTVILFVIGYYLAMAMLSAMMGAVREQIHRR